MNYRLIRHILLLSAIVLFTFGNLIAQSRSDKYLQDARNALSSGDCDAAQIYYDNYTSISGKTSSEIDAAIKKCKDDKKVKPAQPQTPKSPTSKPTANQTGKTNSSGQSGEKPPAANNVTATSTTGTLNGHEWVDLGLPSGTKWATCNVGASSPREYGSFFAWGETKPKSSYTDDNYMYFSDPNVLPASADAATANWGAGWRMPTREEMQELKDKCTWTWMSKGYKVTGPNGNGIFLPAAGYRGGSELYNAGTNGYYWSSSLSSDGTVYAWNPYFYSDYCSMLYSPRDYGFTVRAVCQSQN